MYSIFTRKSIGTERQSTSGKRKKKTTTDNSTSRVAVIFHPRFCFLDFFCDTIEVGLPGSSSHAIVLLVKRKRHATKLSNATSFFFLSLSFWTLLLSAGNFFFFKSRLSPPEKTITALCQVAWRKIYFKRPFPNKRCAGCRTRTSTSSTWPRTGLQNHASEHHLCS